MARGRKAKSKGDNGANLGFEANLWAAADVLLNNSKETRASQEM